MMKPTTSLSAIRPRTIYALPRSLRFPLVPRYYATQTGLGKTPQASKRRSVTPFNDDGHVPWNQLSAAEKAGRATQQSFNFGMIFVGFVLTAGVGYFMWTDVFSPESKTAQFNRAVEKIRKDERCQELFGEPKKIRAHGDETFNKWRRARPIASTEKTDAQGHKHLIMHFHVDGRENNGIAQMHMVKYRGSSEFVYKYLYVDVPGHERVYLEHESSSKSGNKPFSFFGVKWG